MRRVLLPLSFGLIGIAILLSLGIWQLQRLAWKEGVLAQIERELAQDPVPLPAVPDPATDKYRSVRVEGRFDAQTLRVLSGAKHIGAGYELVSAFQTTDGRRVLIDRGFMPLSDATPAPPAHQMAITGNMLWPDDRTSSTPENDRTKNIWFARDVDAMAAALQTEPVLIVARAMTPADATVTLVPVGTDHIPNDHLNYAITWFLLAFVWLVMTIYFIRRETGQAKG